MVDFIKESKNISRAIMHFIRASQGLSPEDDAFNGMTKVENIEERTRLPDLPTLYAIEYMQDLAHVYPEFYELYDFISQQDMKLFISLEGKSREEYVLMKIRSGTPAIIGQEGQQVSMPVYNPQPENKEGKFKGNKKP